jgi:hypothetical protein
MVCIQCDDFDQHGVQVSVMLSPPDENPFVICKQHLSPFWKKNSAAVQDFHQFSQEIIGMESKIKGLCYMFKHLLDMDASFHC